MMKIWNLSKHGSKGRSEWDESVETQKVICPAGHRRGGKRLTDLGVLLTEYPVQALTWTWYSELLVRDEVVELFEKHEVTGYDLRPVRARLKVRADEAETGRANRGFNRLKAAIAPLPELFELVVTGWGGMAQPESGIHLDSECRSCGYLHYSDLTNPAALFDETRWDGSDIFMIWPLPKFIFVTDRVANLVRKHKLKRFELSPIEELRTGGTGFSPGRLHYYFEDKRALAVGTPLGIY